MSGDDSFDDKGTVLTANSTNKESKEEEVERMPLQEVRQEEIISALGVQEEVLQVHGTAPGLKVEGIVRLIYENLDGLSNKMSDNKKLEKEKGISDDLEVDLACFNEHKKT